MIVSSSVASVISSRSPSPPLPSAKVMRIQLLQIVSCGAGRLTTTTTTPSANGAHQWLRIGDRKRKLKDQTHLLPRCPSNGCRWSPLLFIYWRSFIRLIPTVSGQMDPAKWTRPFGSNQLDPTNWTQTNQNNYYVTIKK